MTTESLYSSCLGLHSGIQVLSAALSVQGTAFFGGRNHVLVSHIVWQLGWVGGGGQLNVSKQFDRSEDKQLAGGGVLHKEAV